MGSTVINTAASIQNNSAPAGVSSSAKTSGGGSKSTTTTAGESIDHPLAMTGDEAGADERDIESPTPAILTSSSNSLKPVNAKNIGLHLSNNDIDRIRILVRE